MRSSTELLQKYLRKDLMPTMFCPGCGNGQVLNYTIRAIDDLNIPQSNLVFVSGIGCSSRLPAYIETDGKVATIKVELVIPEGGLAYVTVHLEYALKGSTGWTFANGPEDYYQNLPFLTKITVGGTPAPTLLHQPTWETPFEVTGRR